MSLSNRLVLGVTMISALMLSLLVWNSSRLMTRSHAELIEQATREKGILLAETLLPGLFYNDRAILKDVFQQLRNTPETKGTNAGKGSRPVRNRKALFRDLVYAAVYDRNGRLMATLNGKIHDVNKVRLDRYYRDALKDRVFDIKQEIIMRGADKSVKNQFMGTLYAGFSVARAETLARRTQWQNTLIAIITILLTITATTALGLLFTRHMRKMESGAHALRRGELQHRIPIDRKHDYGGLATAINELADHLEQTQEELHHKHQALEREKKHLQTLLNGINAVVWEADPETCQFTYVSKEAEKLLGYTTGEWLEYGFCEQHLHPDDIAWVLREQKHHSMTPGSIRRDFRMLNKQGQILWIREISNCEIDESGQYRLRGLFLDVTDEIASEERILFLAEHDGLTGLINRRRFQDELKHQIDYADRYGISGALLFIDLDQFKYINDSYGHQVGDEFLVEIAQRLNNTLRKTDFIGRLGGDEFGVILPRADQKHAENVARGLLNSLTENTITVRDRVLHVSASIGITLYPEQGSNQHELLAKADAAMYTAKDQGRNQFHVFHTRDKSVTTMQLKIHWEDRIRDALEKNKFVLHYQPIVDLATGETTQYEALLRMVNDNGALVSPIEFLDTAERFGLIRKIDQWVLDTAIQTQAQSIRDGNPVQIAINLSGRHFAHTELLEIVERALKFHQADPSSIIFEVTETAAVGNLDTARTFMKSLQRLGCRFALDDFGKGYSSYYYIKYLPIDFVKIEGSFIRNLPRDQSDCIFVKALVQLANGLDITTIAECIENEEVARIARSLGVKLGQGYHTGQPNREIISSSYQPDDEVSEIC